MSDPIDARLAHARSVSEQMRNLVDRKKALLDEARLSPDPQAVRTAVDSLRTLNEHARRLRPDIERLAALKATEGKELDPQMRKFLDEYSPEEIEASIRRDEELLVKLADTAERLRSTQIEFEQKKMVLWTMRAMMNYSSDEDRWALVRSVEDHTGEIRPAEILRKGATVAQRAIALMPAGAAFPTYAEFKEKFPWRQLYGNDVEERIWLDFAPTLLILMRWASTGFNVFTLSHGLAAGLLLTDPGERIDVRVPYPVFAVSMPSGVVPYFVADSAGGQQWADTIWVFHTLSAEGGQPSVEIRVGWHGLFVARRLTMAAFETVDGDINYAEEDRVCLDCAQRVVVNFLLWLEAIGGARAEHREHVPRKLAEKRERGGEQWPTQWHFGKEIKLGPELRRMAAEVALGRSKRHAVEGWRLRHRFVVRGHWRNQACGAGRAERRRKWIEPFWKGPAGAEAWSHLYTAEDGKDEKEGA